MWVTGEVFFYIFQFLALASTSSINAGLISTLNPVSIAVSSAFFLKERLHSRQLSAMLLSLIGVVIVLSKGSLGRVLTFHFNSGDLWMIAAVILWGIYSVCGRWAMQKVSPIAATFFSGLFGVILLLPLNIGSFQISKPDIPFILSLLYTGVISTVVCMLLWNMGVQKVGATKSGIFLNFNPIFTAILAFFILKETMTLAELAGSTIVITGCYLFSRH
jgi:drug/metabolite transporter (DMT)-like permease